MKDTSGREVTRLAPSPTGALHLGNARTFLVNWLLARKFGWKILLRIEDLDGPRVKAGADQQAMEDLEFLGLDWDEGPVYQSHRTERYRAEVETLVKEGLAYPCICSRREVEMAASAPHAEDGSTRYPGTCRGKFASREAAKVAGSGKAAIRFAAADEIVEFSDGFAGMKQMNVQRDLGDFVIEKGDGTAAYQLAVVVDDLEAGVTRIVRGDDLLDSTFRQILLMRGVERENGIPEYIHLPLVVGEDGRRLAKRHGNTRIALYREMGVARWRMLSLLGEWCGICGRNDEVGDAAELIDRVELRTIPREAIVFRAADDAWLRGK
jgi:glutamyl-tRNA synthetase